MPKANVSKESASSEAVSAQEDSGSASRSPIGCLTGVVLGLATLLFALSVLSARLTPYTNLARVQALVTPVVPRVSGYVTEVNVQLHSVVAQGDVVFRIDPRPYQIAVESAQAQLALATQQVGAQSATVESATAGLGVARAQLDRAQRNYDRTQRILDANPGALSQADRDRAETALDQALERVRASEADVQRSKEQLGELGADNAQVRAAIAALEKAQLDLEFTAVLAPDDGAIESFNVDVGYYAQPGQALATLVSDRDVWIRADMTENNLGHLAIGDRAEVTFDVAPGRVFEGRVRTVGYGVSEGGSQDRGSLPAVESRSAWMRDPQRFPIVVVVEDEAAAEYLRVGGQADVVVYTGEAVLIDALGSLRIRLASYLSYVR